MKLKNAVKGMCVEVKADKYDAISMTTFKEGDLCIIDGTDSEYPTLRLADLQGNYRGWLDHKDVRRRK